ncbi:hypothetical protein NQ317_011699 [Molorchus minor]|uniref:DDE-1 domain-containing protein n=1 Tax=Molorchus minor TaxID=1323400 RepID=A0ABQ9JRI3_9CUCU|nr:hypothetical protein NQ317_011699 [Molorchus minor]
MLKGAPVGSVGHPSCDESNKILLILDNHDSHISVEGLNFAKENGIIISTYNTTTYTSHKL